MGSPGAECDRESILRRAEDLNRARGELKDSFGRRDSDLGCDARWTRAASHARAASELMYPEVFRAAVRRLAMSAPREI